jgi:K+-sensing histidine kinase KdpD
MLCALRLAIRAAVLASLFSPFAYNCVFIEPIYAETIAERHQLCARHFLVVAVLMG